MQKHNKIIALFLGFLTVFFLLPTPRAHADSSYIGFYLTPSSQTVVNGDTFSVKFMLDISKRLPGVIGINGRITFPNNILNVVSVDTSASNYMHFASTSFDNKAGTITFNRANYFPNEQSTYVFTINFKAVGLGTATAAFDNTTSGQNKPPTYANGGTYVSRAPSCPSGQVGTPPNCTTPPPVVQPTPTKPKPTSAAPTPTPVSTSTPAVVPSPVTQPADTAPIQIDAGDLSIQKVAATNTRTTNTLQWLAAGQNVVSTVQLGTTKTALHDGPAATPQDNGGFLTTFTDLQPGTRYYYTVTAYQSNTPDKKATYSGAFTTRGYPVIITITKNGSALINAKVKIDQSTYTTDKNGAVQLELANKNYDVTITSANGDSKTATIKVAKKSVPSSGDDPEVQKFTFNMTPDVASGSGGQTSSPPYGAIAGAAVGAVALGGGGFGYLFYRRKKAEQLAYPVVAVDEQGWSPESNQQNQPLGPYDAATVAEQIYIPETETPTYPLVAGSVYEPDIMPATSAQPMNYPQPQLNTTGEQLSDNNMEQLPIQGQEPPMYDEQAINTAIPQQPFTQSSEETTRQASDDTPTQANTDEPEAIFDQTTGELDIIHHASRPVNTRLAS